MEYCGFAIFGLQFTDTLKLPMLPSPWTAAASVWTTSSSSRLWRSLEYKAVYLHEPSAGFQAQTGVPIRPCA